MLIIFVIPACCTLIMANMLAISGIVYDVVDVGTSANSSIVSPFVAYSAFLTLSGTLRITPLMTVDATVSALLITLRRGWHPVTIT